MSIRINLATKKSNSTFSFVCVRMSGGEEMFQNRRPITIDIGFIIAVVLIIIVISFADLPIQLSEHIPLAINGLTTATSILVGVSGFLMTHYLSGAKTLELKVRTSLYVLILAATLLFIAGAYVALIGGYPILALKISLVIFNICYLVPISLLFHIVYFTD